MTQPATHHAPSAVKRLTRSRTNRQLAGVCGGAAEYMGIDATIVRLGAVLATLFTWGLAAVAYLLAAIIMPEEQAAPTPTADAPLGFSTPPTVPTYPVTTPVGDVDPTPTAPDPVKKPADTEPTSPEATSTEGTSTEAASSDSPAPTDKPSKPS